MGKAAGAPSAPRDADRKLLLIGYVIRAHGLSGEVQVEPHNPQSELWRAGTLLYTLPREQVRPDEDHVAAAGASPRSLSGCRPQITQGRTRLLCRFEGVDDRDRAEELKGLQLAVETSALEALDDDEFYHHELKGFAVQDPSGAPLGTVVGILARPGQDLIEVQPPAADDGERDTWYVPFVAAMVVDIDRRTRTIVVDPPEGLVP